MAPTQALPGPPVLPEPAYDLWVVGELAEILRVPRDGTRVEIIGGEIVVSPAPHIGRAEIANEIHDVFAVAAANRTGFSWHMKQILGLNLSGLRDAYIPDLLCLEAETFAEVRLRGFGSLLPEHVTLAVEITSPSNAADDREPSPGCARSTKWSGYAREGVPFYLLVDRDPDVCEAILYGNPDRETVAYSLLASWPFGKAIDLPEPFSIEIPTETWQDWTR